MKNLKISILFLFISALMISCNSDDESTPDPNDPDPVACDIPAITNSGNEDFLNPCAIAVSPQGQIIVTTYNEGYGEVGLYRIWASYAAFSTNQLPIQEGFQTAAEAAVFDPTGNLYVAETEETARIIVYLKKGDVYNFSHFIQGGLSNPRGIVFDEGKLYIADDGNGRVVSVTNPTVPNSPIQQEFSTGGSVKAITADENYFYYVQFTENKVVKRSKDDDTTESINVINPVDITLHDGNLYITSPTTKKLTVVSAKIFSEECMETKDGLNASFATAYHPDGGLLMSSSDADKINVLSLQ